MKHIRSRLLFRYWNSLSEGDRPPYRRDIEPHRIKPVLPNTFILQFLDPDHIVFRLAGTRICEIYGREFRDQNFLKMWDENAERGIQMLVDKVLSSETAGLIDYVAETFDKTRIQSEILLLPLRDEAGDITRLLGCAVQLNSDRELMHKKVVRHTINSVHLLNREETLRTPRVANHMINGTTPPYLKLVHSN